MRAALTKILAVLVLLNGNGDANAATGGSFAAEDPLLWAHVIVRGEILDIEDGSTTLEEWGVVSAGETLVVGIENVRVRVLETLKGASMPDTLVVSFRDSLHRPHARPYGIGNEVLLAFYYNAAVDRYQLANYRGLFVREGDDWVHPDPSQFRYSVDSRSLKYEEIRLRVESMGIASVTRSADLIVEAILTTVDESGDDECWSLTVSKVLKGNYEAGQLGFCVRVRGGNRQVQIPRGATPGGRWLLFLAQAGGRFQPLKGKNGMLMLDGEVVLYDLAVPMPISHSQLVSTIDGME